MDPTAMSDDPNNPEYVERITQGANAVLTTLKQQKLTCKDAIRAGGIALTRLLQQVPIHERQRAMDVLIDTIVDQAIK